MKSETSTNRGVVTRWLAWRRPHYARYEWLIMRLALAWLVWQTVSHPLVLTQQPSPIGLAHFLDLTWMGEPWVARPWLITAAVVTALYVLGWLPLLSTGVLLVMHTFVGTLANSQGAIHHATQIIGYVLLGQFLCHLWHGMRGGLQREAVAEGAADRDARPWRDPSGWLGRTAAPGSRHNDWVWFSLQMAAAAYVVSGISKLMRSGFDWVREIPNIPLQFEKNQLMWYYNTLEEQASATSEFAVRMTLEHPQLAQGFFSIGLLLELLAFMVLWRRWMALLFGIGLFMLHTLVTELMNLQFFLNKMVLLVLFMNLPFWFVQLWRGIGAPAKSGAVAGQ